MCGLPVAAGRASEVFDVVKLLRCMLLSPQRPEYGMVRVARGEVELILAERCRKTEIFANT